MKKLINWFYKTKLGLWWLEFLLTRRNRQFEQEFLSAFSFNRTPTEVVQDSVQQKYQEGLNVLRKKVNDQPELITNTELIGLAHEETENQKKLREVMEKIYVNKGQDIKSELDKHQMINRRISDFYSLQRYTEERNLLKQIKQAEKEGKTDLAERLQDDWKQRFRPSIH